MSFTASLALALPSAVSTTLLSTVNPDEADPVTETLER